MDKFKDDAVTCTLCKRPIEIGQGLVRDRRVYCSGVCADLCPISIKARGFVIVPINEARKNDFVYWPVINIFQRILRTDADLPFRLGQIEISHVGFVYLDQLKGTFIVRRDLKQLNEQET